MQQIPTVSPETATLPSPTTSRVVLFLLFVWLEMMALCSIVPHWYKDLFQVNGAEGNAWIIPGGALIFGVLMGLPFLFLWNWRESERYRAIFRTWGWGVLFFLVLIPIRLIPQTQVLWANLLQIILATLFTAYLRKRYRPIGYDAPGLIALIPALVFALPWLLLHTFGSLADTIMNLLAGLAFGGAVAAILQVVLLPALNRTGDTGWNITLGGFATGVLLNVMVAGYGFEGMPWLLMLCVPALGWVIMAYCRWGTDSPVGNRRAITLLTGIAIAAPLILVDPDELLLALNIGGRDILVMGLLAAVVSMAIGWVMGGIAFALRHRFPSDEITFNSLGCLGGSLLFTLLFLVLLGQGGSHGDRLFVILRTQADLSNAAPIADQRERATYVYNTLVEHANSSQADLRYTLGVWQIRHRPYYLMNAIEVDGGPLIRLWLMTRPEVERIIDSPVLRPVYGALPESLAMGGRSTAPDTEDMWNLEMIGAPQVWEEFRTRGAGIIVGQSDSGVDANHPELRNSYLGLAGDHELNWYDPWLFSPQPYDVVGHGTHTLATILGNTVGIAPDAEFIACVNLERNLANPALYLECMQFMMAPFTMMNNNPFKGYPERGAQVLNNSWGCPPIEGCDANALLPAVDALRAAGIFVVASAGNSGPTCSSVDNPLAIYDGAFTVGAVNRSGEVTEFSSRGPVIVDGSGRTKPDVVAPGDDILSAFPNGTYEYAGGTSMAGPHVAGAVTLMWSANPTLIGDIERTEQLLIETATPATDTVDCGDATTPNNSYGYGIINVYEAVKASFE
jgi:subtilisin family serine protease